VHGAAKILRNWKGRPRSLAQLSNVDPRVEAQSPTGRQTQDSAPALCEANLMLLAGLVPLLRRLRSVTNEQNEHWTRAILWFDPPSRATLHRAKGRLVQLGFALARFRPNRRRHGANGRRRITESANRFVEVTPAGRIQCPFWEIAASVITASVSLASFLSLCLLELELVSRRSYWTAASCSESCAPSCVDTRRQGKGRMTACQAENGT